MSKKKPEFDFDDFDNMVELAKINPTMQYALSKLQDALSQAQTVYELTKPADPPPPPPPKPTPPPSRVIREHVEPPAKK